MIEAAETDRRRHPQLGTDRARAAARRVQRHPPDGGLLARGDRRRAGTGAARARVGLAGGRPRPPARRRRRGGDAALAGGDRGGAGGGRAALEAALRPALARLRRADRGRLPRRWSTSRATRCGCCASGCPRRCRRPLLGAGAGDAGGRGALRRRRRPRLRAAQPAAELGDRDGADLRRPRLRLAGGEGRLSGDRRGLGRGDPRARRPDRDRPAGALARRAAGGRRRRPRPRPARGRWSWPAIGCPPASPAPTAATSTAPAPSSSTSRSRAACRGRYEPARRAGTVHAIGSFEEMVAGRGRGQPRPHARASLRPRRPAVPRRPEPLAGRPAPDLGLRPRPQRLHRRRHRGDPRPDRALRPGLPRADRRPRHPLRPRSRPPTPTSSAATSSPAPTRRCRPCSAPASPRSPTRPGPPASSSAPPRPRPVPAPTASAASTPPKRSSERSEEVRRTFVPHSGARTGALLNPRLDRARAAAGSVASGRASRRRRLGTRRTAAWQRMTVTPPSQRVVEMPIPAATGPTSASPTAPAPASRTSRRRAPARAPLAGCAGPTVVS